MGYIFILFVVFCCKCCFDRVKSNKEQHNATLHFQHIVLNFSHLQQKQRKQRLFVISPYENPKYGLFLVCSVKYFEL